MSWLSAGLSTLSNLSESVQKAIPVDSEMLAKLTLNTEEMKQERQQFGEEQKRKNEVKNMLAGLLPWETRDKEREILVEECKEAILKLSSQDETFFGPYKMPALPVKADTSKKSTQEEGANNDDDDDDDDEDEDHENVTSSKKKKDREPSEAALEKLAKLEPLPPLLGEFDLDSHVGLIQRILGEDPQLVKMQSSLSGGGSREEVFWHNYFFHCAYTRYEAGLSIDEIWSDRPQEVAGSLDNSEPREDENTEETVVFDAATESETPSKNTFMETETETPSKNPTAPAVATTNTSSSSPSSERDVLSSDAPTGSVGNSVGNDFELVSDADDGGLVDPELDELEAEIARELED